MTDSRSSRKGPRGTRVRDAVFSLLRQKEPDVIPPVMLVPSLGKALHL
jgi:hypothetical protein